MADEVTDGSNKKHFVLSFRWIHKAFDYHEDFIGIYNVDYIKADTLVTVIKEFFTKAFFTHCFGHALNLAVVDMVKNIRFLKDSMETT